MKYIILGEAQIKNLNTFLDRVPLTGRIEAIAMVEIVNTINYAQEVKEPVPVDEKQISEV